MHCSELNKLKLTDGVERNVTINISVGTEKCSVWIIFCIILENYFSLIKSIVLLAKLYWNQLWVESYYEWACYVWHTLLLPMLNVQISHLKRFHFGFGCCLCMELTWLLWLLFVCFPNHILVHYSKPFCSIRFKQEVHFKYLNYALN